MGDREERIRLLSRIGRVNRSVQPFLISVSNAIGEAVVEDTLMPPQDTDTLAQTFHAGYQSVINGVVPGFRRVFLKGDRAKAFRLFDCVADHVTAEEGFWITKLGSDAIALRLALPAVLKHPASILSIDRDSIYVLSKDGSQGLFFDHNPDDALLTYEVAVWGPSWPLLFVVCDH